MNDTKFLDKSQFEDSENWKIISEQYDILKGQFVITEHRDNTVERLIGIGCDDMDWYYITYNGKDIKWCSCVCRIIPLKGFINDDDYNYLIHIAKLNDDDQIFLDNDQYNKFEENITKYISELKTDNKILLGLHWDLDKKIKL